MGKAMGAVREKEQAWGIAGIVISLDTSLIHVRHQSEDAGIAGKQDISQLIARKQTAKKKKETRQVCRRSAARRIPRGTGGGKRG